MKFIDRLLENFEVSLVKYLWTKYTSMLSGGYVVWNPMFNILPLMKELEVREDDIWLIGLPKSGNTWASELIWTIYHNADIDTAKQTKHMDRWCFPEYSCLEKCISVVKWKRITFTETDSLSRTVECKSPRLIRTHFFLNLLPANLLDTAKVVYIARNPKDVLVSMYHFTRATFNFPICFTSYVAAMMDKQTGVIRQYSMHLTEVWEKRHHPNLLFIFYEDMKKDLSGVVRKVADFLEKELTEEEIEKLEKHLSFNDMRENRMVNMQEYKDKGIMKKHSKFIRKGIVGDWRNHFNPNLEKMFNKCWSELNCKVKFPEEEEVSFTHTIS